MLELTRRTRRELAGGVSFGCGLAAAIQTNGIRESYAGWLITASLALALLSILLGIRSSTRRPLPFNSMSLRRMLDSLSPLAIAGALVSFVITLVVPAVVHSIMPPFLLMIIIALASTPHMLLYLGGSERYSEFSARESQRRGIQPPIPKEEEQFAMLRSLHSAARNRILDEINALARRGNLNLIIGILTTLAAIGLLASIVLTAKAEYANTAAVLSYYIPRVSFVVFVEVFSFFFLRLYRGSLEGIKYFQNELTNVELRFISIEMALLDNPSSVLAALVLELVKTERNFILKQGESTVELRKYEVEADGYKQAFAALGEMIKGIRTNHNWPPPALHAVV